MGAVAVDSAIDDGADMAVGDCRSAVASADNTCCIIFGGIDVACYLEILDGCIVDVSERGAILFAEGTS